MPVTLSLSNNPSTRLVLSDAKRDPLGGYGYTRLATGPLGVSGVPAPVSPALGTVLLTVGDHPQTRLALTGSMAYHVGDVPVITGVFDDYTSGTAVDPGTLTVTVTPPTGISVVYVYGVDSQLTKAGVGIYKLTLPASIVGTWTSSWVATGANAASSGPYTWAVS